MNKMEKQARQETLIDLCAKMYTSGFPDLAGMMILTEKQGDWIASVAARAGIFCIPRDGVRVGGWMIAESSYRKGGKTRPGHLLRLWPELSRRAA